MRLQMTRDTSDRRGGRARVAILLGLYDGAAHLGAQLDSFARQTSPEWDLIVSDDGSRDGGPGIVSGFARDQAGAGRRVRLVDGPARGVAVNFLSLLAHVPDDADWVAFSDQDDVWLPDRLARGQRALAAVPRGQPALFGSATWIVDDTLRGHRLSPAFPHPPGFRNALVQSIAGGNTMLLNRAGADLARAAAAEALAAGSPPVTHDWWLYQLISGAGGVVIRSEEPTLLYRQHEGNLFGTNRGARAVWQRLRQVASGELAAWIACNAAALGASAHRLTPENRALLARFAALGTQDMVSRLRGLREMGVHRQGRAGQAALWLAALAGRL